MGQISAGTNFGNDVAQPARLNEVALPRAAFGVNNAAQTIGQLIERQGEEVQRAHALRVNVDAEFELNRVQQGLVDDVRAGRVAREDVSKEWNSRSKDVIDVAIDQTPQQQRALSREGLAARSRRFELQLLDNMRQFDQESMRADIGRTLQGLTQLSGTDRAGALASAGSVLKSLGPAAGYGPDDVQKMLGVFRSATAETEAKRAILAARGDPAALTEIDRRLTTDEFSDLQPQQVLQLQQHIAARQEYLQHQAEAMQRLTEREASAREQALYGTAQLQVELNGVVDPELWVALKDGHRASLLQRQRAEARAARMEAQGKPIKTDWPVYLALRELAINEPGQFAQLDLKQYVDRIGGPQLEQLADLKSKKITELGKAPKDAVTFSQQANATMQALKITKPADKGRFLSYVQTEVDQATSAKGKPLTFEERQKIIDAAVLQGPDPDAWLWGTKRMYQLTPEQRTRFKPDASVDAPATEIDALNAALAQQGLAQTAANRLALYQRHMSRNGQ